jgi:signal transduction histidine kinase
MIRRLWPNTMAGRFALVLVAGLLVLAITAAALYLYDRGERTVSLFARAMAEQVGAMANLLEATPKAQRQGILAALGGPMMRVEMTTKGPNLAEGHWKRPDEFPDPIRRHLGTLETRQLFVRLFRPWENGRAGRHHHGHRMVIAVGLKDGTWLRVGLHRGRPPWGRGMGPLGWLIVTIVLVLIAAVWAAHRMTRPFRRFAQAADRFGVDVRAPPMPEHGSRELRRAAVAFNRMQERLRRFVDDRTMMLAAISHDLRTVLTRLRLRAEFIEDGQQQDKAIADIDEMQAMLDETLSFARDDAQEETTVETDLSVLLQSLCSALSDMGQTANFDGPAHLSIPCRPIALRRAFRNLLDNAIRYGARADVTLSLDNGEAVVEIVDDGPGIAEDMREKVFQPFFRLEASRSRETGGTGLGLSSARAVMRRHGGDITLDNAPTGGLRVHVTLPLETD